MINSKTMTSIYFIVICLCILVTLVIGILHLFAILSFAYFWYTMISALFTALAISLIYTLHAKLFGHHEESEQDENFQTGKIND